MTQVGYGIQLSHKGWTALSPGKMPRDLAKNAKKHAKQKEIVGPDNKVYLVEGVLEFCLANNFKINSATHLIRKVLSGKQKHYHGWRLPENMDYDWRARPEYKTAKAFMYKFISPDGLVYENVTNLTKFCEEHGVGLTNFNRMMLDPQKRKAEGWSCIPVAI